MNSEPYHPSYRERKSEADIHDAWYNIDERIKPSTEYIDTILCHLKTEYS